jgi:hypothetical protein
VKKIKVTAANGEDMTAELSHFATIIGLEAAAPGRYSMLLVLGLFGGFSSRRLIPAKVIHEIRALEGIGKPSRLKPPIQNKHPPLKGLWHKHYMESGLRAVAMNLRRGLQKHGLPLFEQRVREAREAGEERYMVPDDVKAIVDDAVQGNLSRLSSAAALTGEWILYARHKEANYYLCLATHDESQHDNIRRQIDALCCQEFPFLAALLDSA